MSKQTAEALADTEILPSLNKIILSKIMTDISNEIVNSDSIFAIAEKRRTMVWFEEYKDYYTGIVALAKMNEFYKENAAGFHIVGAKKIWDSYTKEFYKMDTYYRQFHMSYENSKNPMVETCRIYLPMYAIRLKDYIQIGIWMALDITGQRKLLVIWKSRVI